MQSKYSWGIDGLGRAHLYIPPSQIIIFTMIDGCGRLGQIILEEQDENEIYRAIRLQRQHDIRG